MSTYLDASLVDEPGLRPRPSIAQMMPGAVVARPPGGFSGEDGPDTPFTYRRQQWAQAWALVASRATAAPVLIEHEALGNPQPVGMIRAGILPPLALGVGADWRASGLADIEIGVTVEMGRVHLGVHGYTPRAGHWG